jgi:hypothetical protein
MDYEKMSNEQLEKESQKLTEQRREIKAKKAQIANIMDRRAAAKRVALMSEKEKADLAQEIQASSVAPAEEVGEPETK